ncbi:phosphatase and actin regulator 2 [Trichonephila clavipes]|nr:phosphatase and actin regulator 2 [Trichonephila clavipes]
MLFSIIFITSGKVLRESGQPIGRLRKICKKVVPGTIPFSFGRVDTSIATESVLNAEEEDEFSALKTKAFLILLPFSTSYLCETGFSVVAVLKTIYRSQLKKEKELRVSFSNTNPSFENFALQDKPITGRRCAIKRLEPIDENSSCVEVRTTHKHLRRGVNSNNFKNYFSSNDITCEEVKSQWIHNVFFIGYIVRASNKGARKKDERVSRNEREVTLEKQKIELAELQLAKLEKEVELQRAKNKALSLNPAAKVEEKQFETLNKETATHIGIREAEDWFRPIDLAKECDIYISSKTDHRFKPKESNDHFHNRINVNTLKVESEKQNSDEFSNLQYVSIFVENQPVTALIDSGCQIPVLNSSLIRVNQPSEEIITFSSCFGEQRMVEVKPINISLNQHSPGLSVRTAISPTLTEEIIIHPSVYSEIEKLGHAKSDVLLSESGSSLGVHFNSNVSFSNVIENSSYDLPHVKNFNTRNDSSSLIKDYKCNKIKSTKLKLSIIREKCSDIVLCKKVNGAMKTSSMNFNAPSPMKSKYRRFVLLRKIFELWQWKRRKKRNRFEQTSRTLERKISMRSTKDQLVKKDVLMPVKHNVFLWNLPDVEEVPSHDGETV